MLPETPVRDRRAVTGSTVEFRITEAMLERFATLTGDRSSLHVDEAFARRSAYRERIVHGMLPIACAALLPSIRIPGQQAVIIGLSGRFVAPVRPGESLRVVAEPARSSGDHTAGWEFAIKRDETVVTTGSLTVSYGPSTGEDRPAHGSLTDSLLTADAALNAFTLEELEPGTRDRLDFTVTDGTVAALLGLFAAAGHRGPELASLPEQVHLPNLMSVLLFSTSIGVSLPGASATFLDFHATVDGRIALNVPYHLDGRVSHRSAATRIVKKELLVLPRDTQAVVVRGKASALVATPSRSMPTVREIHDEGVDLGLKDKVVIITGASRGIGETTAKLFALHGARVIVNYCRGEADAQRVVGEIADAGGEALAVGADVSAPDGSATLCRQALERYGTVDVLVNNAARDCRPVPFLALSWEDVQRDLDVIAKGAFLCAQAVLPVMLEKRHGRIINVASVAVDIPPTGQAKYVMAKSALVGLTRSLAVEYASQNIHSNLVVPGFVETDFVAHVGDGFRQKVARDTPMKRNATPLDVARAIVVLASRYSSFTNGQKVMVTGGAPPYL